MRSLSLALAMILVASSVHAEAPKSGSVVAEALFREGKRLMNEGKFAAACPKLEESQRIDPKLGVLLNLAACHAAEGKTATAWAEYNEAASQAARAGRAEYLDVAKQQIAELEPKLARLVIKSAASTSGLVVTLDGTVLGAGSLGSALPVDPGAHTVIAKAPGKTDWSKTIEISQGPSTQTVTVPALEEPVVAAPAPTKEVERPSRITPLVVTFGALTVVSAGVGTYFGLRASKKNSDAEAACPGGLCRGDGLDLDRDARTSATISTIAFSVSLAAAIGTVWSYVASKNTEVQVGVAPTGLTLRGVF